MKEEKSPLVLFLQDLMRRRKLLPSHLAVEMGVSHATVSRWLSGKDLPSVRSCQRLADYSGVSFTTALVAAGYLDAPEKGCVKLPEFRQYAHQKYPEVLDEDVIIMIEDLIERRRSRTYDKKRLSGRS